MNPTGTNLELIDIASFDDDDGGIDAGLDTTKFPRTPGYRSRAQQAGDQWQRQQEADELAEHDAHSVAPATRQKYEANWQIFGGWCHHRGIDPYDAEPDDIRAWILELTRQNLKMPTIDGRLAAVRFHFDAVGRPSPTSTSAVATTLDAARNRIGEAKRRARPLLLDDLRRIGRGDADGVEQATRPPAGAPRPSLAHRRLGGCAPSVRTRRPRRRRRPYLW